MKILLIILTLALSAVTSANAYFIFKSKSDKNGETGKTAVTTTTDKKLTTAATATKKAAAPQNNLPQQGSAGGKTSTTPNAAQPGKSEKMGASSSGITPAKNEDANKRQDPPSMSPAKKQDSPNMSTIAQEVQKKKNKK